MSDEGDILEELWPRAEGYGGGPHEVPAWVRPERHRPVVMGRAAVAIAEAERREGVSQSDPLD